MKSIMRNTVCRLFLLFLIFTFTVSAKGAVPDYLSSGMIAHACGGIGRSRYTNSQEALDQTLKKGASAVEIDFAFTSDGSLVCIHDWDRFGGTAPTLAKFLKKKTRGGYTPMTAKKALGKLIRNKDAFLIVDTKEKDTARVYREIVRICRGLGYSSYLRKVVPQIYKTSEYARLKRIFPFRNWIFSLYKMPMKSLWDYVKIARFCQKNGIGAVAVSTKRITKQIIRRLHYRGLTVAVHTVNRPAQAASLKKKGVDVFYTGVLYP